MTAISARRLAAVAGFYFLLIQGMLGESAFQQLHEFSAVGTNPRFPVCKLAEGAAGIFYGTTTFGGSNDLGTVFKITHHGDLTMLHSFNGTNGRRPFGGLVLASDDNFYGTTTGAGVGGYGTVFRIDSGEMLTTVATFGYTNGAGPRGQLVQGSDGFLYGTTQEGGGSDLGTVFKVTTNGLLTSLVSFRGTNGANPFSGLVFGSDGNLYGTTAYGGSNFAGGFTGHGTVFKVTTNGTLTTLAYFNGNTGIRPASLSSGSDGNFYGTTQMGGMFNLGTVFRIMPEGGLHTLLAFDGTNGLVPMSGVTQGADGKIYGVTPYGTENTNTVYGSVGIIYSVTTNGLPAIVARFDGTNAQNPFAELTLAKDGNLYGVAGDIARQLSLDGNTGLFFRLARAPVIETFTRTDSEVRLMWTSFVNGIYRVEYKTSLLATNWTTLDPQITATGGISSVIYSTGSELEGYYRVMLKP